MDDSHDADAMVSKETFSLLSTSKTEAVGMDIKYIGAVKLKMEASFR